MIKTVSTLVAGIFFFSSLTGMGQWSFSPIVYGASFDLEDEEEFEEEPAKKEEPVMEEKEKEKPSLDEEGEEEDFEETPSDKKESATSRDDLDEEDSGGSKGLAVFYFFADSNAEKKARDLVRTMGTYLSELSNYRFLESDARIFNDFSFEKLTEDSEKAQKYLDEGKKLLDDGEAEEAISKFNAAVDLLEKRIDVLYDYKLLTKALFYTGATWKLLEEEDKASGFFKKVLVINPDYEAEEGTDEDTMDFFDKLKSKMMMQPLGDLKVTSEPSGATIYIDGRIVGATPMTVEGLVSGKHYWRIHKSGYRDVGGVVTVRDGEPEKIDELLKAGDGAEPVAQFEKLAVAEFGGSAMMQQAITVGKAAKVDRVFAVHTSVGEGDTGAEVKVQLRLLNVPKASYKEENLSFPLPSSGDFTRVEDLRHSFDNLFADEFGFNPVSSIVSGSLSLDRKKDEGSIVTAWWFWTIIGTVVAGGVTTGCLLAIPGSPLYLGGKSSSGATMTVEFTP